MAKIKKIVKIIWDCQCGNKLVQDVRFVSSEPMVELRQCLMCKLFMLKSYEEDDVDADLVDSIDKQIGIHLNEDLV